MVELPATLLAEVDSLVQTGYFPSREIAIAELVRLGLQSLQTRRPPMPARPPPPPGVTDPTNDQPISVDPKSDVNWMP